MMNMRDAFLNEILAIAKTDRRVVLLSDDFGGQSLEAFKHDLPGQYLFMGIAEQNMTSVAAGLALSGKIVFTYAITPFLIERCFEQLRLDVGYMNLHVNAVGVGAGFSYDTAGPTHHALDDIALASVIPNMTILSPSDNISAAHFARMAYRQLGPKYIRLDRGVFPDLWKHDSTPPYDFAPGMGVLTPGGDLAVLATGRMVHRALELANELTGYGVATRVIDVYRLKPMNSQVLRRCVEGVTRVTTLEEHTLYGGLGSMVSQVLECKSFGIPDTPIFQYDGRESLDRRCGLDVKSLTEAVVEWLG